MKQFKLVNNVLGWLTFLFAATVYCLTIEPTASFWDCPEFILSGYKLEVGHPPGAPFFMLTANLFSQFAGDPTQVARMVNIMNALLSASCILFLFWSITHLVRKLLINNPQTDFSLGKIIAIEASGLVGALIYTFSDTFWFSAVEGEVYAYSSAFTAVVFWLILKWEDHANEPQSDRWLILIAYLMGLSIGVHLLNLLCIPAIVLVFYYKKYPNADLKGSLIALAGSFVIVAAVLYGVIPDIITVGGWFELLFVNHLKMPFNTGVIVYIILLVSIVLWSIYETYQGKSRKRENISFLLAIAMLGIPFYGYGWSAVVIGVIILAGLYVAVSYKRNDLPLISTRLKNTTLLCLLMLMIGYSTYAVIVIRSAANTPMDQNSPEDIFTLGDYLGRKQYGDKPLFYGQAYSSQAALKVANGRCTVDYSPGAPVYQRKAKASPEEKDNYIVVEHKDKTKYAQNMLFPRMWSSRHAELYEEWLGGVEGTEVAYDRCGENIYVKVPTQLENLRFFFSYQCNWMYWRYFMWNFAGRQNDIQGHGGPENGNWITGIPFIDNLRLGDQSLLPDDLKNNKGRNVFYCLPLILGLIGLFWQAWHVRKRKVVQNGIEKTITDNIGIKQFWIVFFLFFMTGLAIVVYLNQEPMQPRERDYAYAGSFYAFAIWCGMGVAAIINIIQRKIKVNQTALAAAIGAICLFVPFQMASQTWDDHDRSDRYACRDFGQNYLASLPEDQAPIIFTNGDNDTFPLWYLQEVEGFRTDARVCNLSYLNTDWYIDQMRRPAYDSPALPINWERIKYSAGTNDGILIQPEARLEVEEFYKSNPEEAVKAFGEEPFELRNIIDRWILSDNPDYHIIPTNKLYITIDKEAVRKSGMMVGEEEIPEKMVIDLTGRQILYKKDLMLLELLANTNWTRPVYVATSVASDEYLKLNKHLVSEGLAKRFTPFTLSKDSKTVDTERTYDIVMNKFKFGNVNKENIYLDETILRMCYTHRLIMVTLAQNLIEEGKMDKAEKVLDYTEEQLPSRNIPRNPFQDSSIEIAKGYLMIGADKKADKVLDELTKTFQQYLNWYLSMGDHQFQDNQYRLVYGIQRLSEIGQLIGTYNKEKGKKVLGETQKQLLRFQQKGGNMQYFMPSGHENDETIEDFEE